MFAVQLYLLAEHWGIMCDCDYANDYARKCWLCKWEVDIRRKAQVNHLKQLKEMLTSKVSPEAKLLAMRTMMEEERKIEEAKGMQKKAPVR